MRHRPRGSILLVSEGRVAEQGRRYRQLLGERAPVGADVWRSESSGWFVSWWAGAKFISWPLEAA
jgi:hypothetical protein